ncbi:caspase domain-containing protein [Irpex rosettiformis]|uniref:Caspase domain-containing protein n=1 Tax=Irpex rosettiformis TaxID=378272 RepID=A0ACB8U4K4_9APHY|nr:caspase domain-containing protein [Irpex rosettiformis]
MSNSLRLPRLRTRAVKKALSIAIRYSHLRDQGFELAHAHKDSVKVVKLLTEKLGYSYDNITLLKDCDDGQSRPPTRNNIIQAMRDLVSNSMPGDHLICHISGHGSQRKCPIEGQEKDGKDEIFWPVDVEFHDDEIKNYILDDEIKEILVDGVQPGVNLVLIVDCCHSGTIADLPHGHSDHSPRTKGLSIEEKGYSSFGCNTAMEPDSAITEPGEEAMKRMFPNVVCWSACKDDEITYSPSNNAGIFVQLLAKAIREDVSQTHQQLLHKVTEMMEDVISRYNSAKRQTATYDEPDPEPIRPPKPYLSTLCSQSEILHLPIFKTFGRNLDLSNRDAKELYDFHMILSPVAT